MKRTILLCLLLCGCATATKLNTGNGTIYRVECDGAAVPLSVCYKKANEVCATGWDQLAADGSLIPQGVMTADVAHFGMMEKKSITVRCR
jgi:hypothetical protein